MHLAIRRILLGACVHPGVTASFIKCMYIKIRYTMVAGDQMETMVSSTLDGRIEVRKEELHCTCG